MDTEPRKYKKRLGLGVLELGTIGKLPTSLGAMTMDDLEAIFEQYKEDVNDNFPQINIEDGNVHIKGGGYDVWGGSGFLEDMKRSLNKDISDIQHPPLIDEVRSKFLKDRLLFRKICGYNK